MHVFLRCNKAHVFFRKIMFTQLDTEVLWNIFEFARHSRKKRFGNMQRKWIWFIVILVCLLIKIKPHSLGNFSTLWANEFAFILLNQAVYNVVQFPHLFISVAIETLSACLLVMLLYSMNTSPSCCTKDKCGQNLIDGLNIALTYYTPQLPLNWDVSSYKWSCKFSLKQ